MLCCLDADERRHAAAVKHYDGAAIRLTHNYVLAEFVALCQARSLPRDEAIDFAADILQDPDVEVVWIDPQTHQEAMQLLKSQLDKSYSLCDAVSFVVMRRRNLANALTTDRHLSQAGFQRLLPP